MENTSVTITDPMDNSSGMNNLTVLFSLPIGPGFFDAYNIYLYLMITFGAVGNLIVLVVFFNSPPSNTTDWFILSITVCDFISSLVNVPVYVTFTNGYWQIFGSTLICRLHMFLSQSIVLSSSFLICGLALDRYLKICRQLSSFTPARARSTCILITALTTVLSIPCFVMFENRAGRCVSIVMDKTLFAYYLLVFMIFIFATTVVVFSYVKVTKAVVASEANVARHTENTDIGGRNKHTYCFCCFPSRRNNRVGPSISLVSRSGIFKDTLFNTTYEQSSSSGQHNPVGNKDHLQVPKAKHNLQINHPRPFDTNTGKIEEPSTTNNQLRSRTSNKHFKQRKSTSVRTTKISFLVCSVFIVSWIPPWLCFVLASIPGIKSNINVIKFMLFGKMTYLVNGFSNPIIYTMLNKKFRTRILQIFCCQKL